MIRWVTSISQSGSGTFVIHLARGPFLAARASVRLSSHYAHRGDALCQDLFDSSRHRDPQGLVSLGIEMHAIRVAGD